MKILKMGADGIARVVASPRFLALWVLAVLLFVGSFGAYATADPNEVLVDGAVTALTATFATVFALGLGVVIAMIAKKYLRRAT